MLRPNLVGMFARIFCPAGPTISTPAEVAVTGATVGEGATGRTGGSGETAGVTGETVGATDGRLGTGVTEGPATGWGPEEGITVLVLLGRLPSNSASRPFNAISTCSAVGRLLGSGRKELLTT